MSRTRNGRPDRTRAIILVPSEVETALGGRETAWAEAGVFWFAVDTRGMREAAAPAGRPVLIETARVACRAHPNVERGVRLSTSDGEWAVTLVEADAPAPGRAVLHIRRV